MSAAPASRVGTWKWWVCGLLLLATGCSNGQLVDAGGERGAGGLAFVLMAVAFWLFFGALFYMDRVRKRRTPPE